MCGYSQETEVCTHRNISFYIDVAYKACEACIHLEKMHCYSKVSFVRDFSLSRINTIRFAIDVNTHCMFQQKNVIQPVDNNNFSKPAPEGDIMTVGNGHMEKSGDNVQWKCDATAL